MLRLEDYQTGSGCTDLQKLYRDDLLRMKPISRKQLRRKMLVVAVAPKPENVRRGSEPCHFEALERFDPERLIVLASETDIYLMFDRPIQSDRPGHRVETLILGETGYLDEGVGPSIGGRKNRNHADYDYASKPFYACQGGDIRLHTGGHLKAIVGGKFRVRRIGSWLDLCVGEVSGHQPMINYRLGIGHCTGDKAVVEIKGLTSLPENGEMVTVGTVNESDVIAELRRPVEHFRAGFDNKRPVMITRAKKLIPAHHEREFELFIKMNRTMLKYTPKNPGDSRPFLLDPTRWAFPALFRFERLSGLVHNGDFAVTQKLQDDLLDAVGPRGTVDNRTGKQWYLNVRSTTSGRISAINTGTNDFSQVEIVFDDGTKQVAPDYPYMSGDGVLYTYQENKTRKTLDVGDKIIMDQVIGDYVPRMTYNNWDELMKAAGYNAPFMIEEFLASRAITPGTFGWEGPGILLDYRYCYPFVEQLAMRDGHEKLQWYWDLRSGAEYLDKDKGYIVYPPMRYSDWGSSTMNMAGVSYFLGLYPDKSRTERASRNRVKKGRKSPRKANEKAAEVDVDSRSQDQPVL